jgi:hypothetical protein
MLEVWAEPGEKQTRDKRWRARIIHVPSGKQKYVDNFPELVAFVASYIL